MFLRKNTASQTVTFCLVNSSTGAALTGATVSVRRCIDGTFAATTGSVTEDSAGLYKFTPSQADTNGDQIGYYFTATSAIPVCLNVRTTAADMADSVRFGLTALPNAAAGASGGLPTGNASGHVTLADSSLVTAKLGTFALAKTTNITGFNDIAATAIVSSGAITTSGGAVSTVTTVTNQLTAAAIATGVWQDTTAGDFTVASSIGRSLYTSGTLPGASGGHFIAGTNAATTITSSLTTTFTGNLTGSVGSVSGAVGSVTGNVGGNVTGSVGSVVGAVGSVTGNVGGNVVGTVASVVGAVGSVTARVTANTDQLAGQTVTAAAGVTFPTSVASPTNITAGTITTATNVTTVNGLAANVITAASMATDASAEIADAVWDEVLSGHLTGGSTGAALNAAGSAGDPWGTALPGAYTAGSAGFIIGTNMDATITSRLAPTTAGRTLDVTATGAAGIDWGNVENPTTTLNLSGTTVKTATDVVADTQNIQTRLPAALTGTGLMQSDVIQWNGEAIPATNATGVPLVDVDRVTGASVDSGSVQFGVNVVAMDTNVVTAAALSAAAVTKIQTGLATPTNITAATGIVLSPVTHTGATIPTVTTTGTATNLTNAPTAGDLTATMKASVTAAVPTAAANATAVLAAGDVDGYTLEQTLKLCLAALAGKLSGAATTTIAIRSADDTANRVVATVDADGNRTAVTLNAAG